MQVNMDKQDLITEPPCSEPNLSEPSISETELDVDTDNTNVWQRLSPIAIVYFGVKFIVGLLGNIVYLAPALILGYKQLVENPWIWGPAIIAGLALITLSAFLSFYFFQYRLSNGHIEIRSGVLAKKYVNLPFGRIQNVKLEQPIYYRPWHFTCLQLDTAGSAKQEAKIVALKSSFAEALKKEILASHKTAPSDEATEAESAQNFETLEVNDSEKVINRRSLTDLVIHGLTNNRIWLFLGGLAPFFDDIGNYVVDFFTSLGIDLEQLFSFADKSWWQISIYALTLTFIIFVPITLFSVAGSIISFYDYKLSKIGDRYIRRSGLFTKHEVTMRFSRLQMIVRQQDWLDVLLKRINLKFEQSNANMQNMQPGAHNNKIIVPSIKEGECRFLIRDVYPDSKLFTLPFKAISKRFLLRNIGFILTPIFVCLASFFVVIEQYKIALLLTPVYAVLSLLVYCRWRRWGYNHDENYIYIRKGQLGVDYYCFPKFKVQQTTYKQSKFLKPHKLCSIKFVLASGGQTIPFIPEQEGFDLLNDVLYQLETTRKPWM